MERERIVTLRSKVIDLVASMPNDRCTSWNLGMVAYQNWSYWKNGKKFGYFRSPEQAKKYMDGYLRKLWKKGWLGRELLPKEPGPKAINKYRYFVTNKTLALMSVYGGSFSGYEHEIRRRRRIHDEDDDED